MSRSATWMEYASRPSSAQRSRSVSYYSEGGGDDTMRKNSDILYGEVEVGEGSFINTNGSSASRCVRLVFLICCCLCPLGSQTMYNLPAATGNSFKEYYNMSTTQFGLLYSMYALPNLVIVFFVGSYVDRVGPATSALIFNGIILIAATAMRMSEGKYIILLASFCFFGIGSANILLSQMALLTKWYRGKELALSFGLSTSILRMQSTIDYNLYPWVAQEYHTKTYSPLLFPFLISIMAMVTTILIKFMDWHRFYGMPSAEQDLDKDENCCTEAKEIKYMNFTFWIAVLVCCSITMADFLFEMYAVAIFTDRGLTPAYAGRAVSTTSIAIIFLTPISAYIGDRYGHYGHIMLAGASIQLIGCIMLAYDFQPHWTAYLISAFFGTGYACGVSVMWAAVALVLDDKFINCGYGIMNALLNLWICVLPFLMGFLYDFTNSYSYSIILIMGICILGIISSFVIIIVDRKRGRVLKYPNGSSDVLTQADLVNPMVDANQTAHILNSANGL